MDQAAFVQAIRAAQAAAQKAVMADTDLSKAFEDMAAAVEGNSPEPIPPEPEPEQSPFQREVVAIQTNPRIVRCADRAALDSYAADGPRPNDRLVLTGGHYGGGSDLTINLPVDAAEPWIICCDGDDARLLPTIKFKLVLKGKGAHVWGLKFGPHSSGTGRLQLSGAVDPVIERCEFLGWLPNNMGSAPGQHGHAIHLVQGGSGAIIRRCFVHDPGAFTQAEKVSGGGSDRIFMRIEGSSKDALHKNGLVEHCWFGSTKPRPVPNNYGSGQLDLAESASNGSDYGPAPGGDIGWTYRNNVFDGTGQGGPPIGFDLVLSGDVDSNPSGVVDTKTGGVRYEANTFRNFQPRVGGSIGHLDFRYGQGNVARGNHFSKAILGSYGGKHIIVSNKCVNGGFIACYTGTQEWNEYRPQEHQGSFENVYQDNEADIYVGKAVSDPNFTVAARAAKFRGRHKGKIYLSNSHAPYDTAAGGFVLDGSTQYGGGQKESGATFSGERVEDEVPVPQEPPVTNAEVGPFS
jgi:hypothetical protein